MTGSRLDQLEVFVGQWRRGHLDGQEVVVDCLTNLRHFAALHAVDFDDALRVSGEHFEAESVPEPTGREIVSVGLDGRSQPMWRYADELWLPEHRRSVVSAADRPAPTSEQILEQLEDAGVDLGGRRS